MKPSEQIARHFSCLIQHFRRGRFDRIPFSVKGIGRGVTGILCLW